jgi:hypothetical protein
MQERTARLLAGALARFSADESAQFLVDSREQPASRTRPGDRSRQARHARYLRASYLATASALLLGGDEPELGDLAFEPDFARLRPSSASVHTRLVYLSDNFGAPSERSMGRYWDRALPRFLALCERIPTLDADGLLCFHGAVTGLLLGPVLRGRAFEPAWRELWKISQRRGILSNPYVRVWLAMMGSYVGHPGPHVEMLMDPRMRTLDLLDALYYARRDRSASLLDATTRMIRGEVVHPDTTSELLAEMPRSAWLRLGDYVRACTRMRSHFNNEGLILMLLSWVEAIARTGLILARQDGTTRDVTALVGSLKRIESVQAIESSRFWRVVGRTADGPVKGALVSMWNGTSAH